MNRSAFAARSSVRGEIVSANLTGAHNREPVAGSIATTIYTYSTGVVSELSDPDEAPSSGK